MQACKEKRKPIKIAYLIDYIAAADAGTEKQLLEIIDRLDRRIFEPLLICLMGTPWLETSELPCKKYTLGYKGLLKKDLPKVVTRLKDILNNEDIDILQTFFEDSIFIGFLGSLITPRRLVLVSSRRDMGLGDDNPWYHKLYKIMLPFLNRRFDTIVANSQAVKTFVSSSEKTPSKHIAIIPNGISFPDDDTSIPQVFLDHKADIWFGMTANLKPVKRVDIFLQALSLLEKQKDVDFHAIILGDGKLRKNLREMSSSMGLSGRVHFMGSVENVYAYVRNIHVGVLCSDSEGLSNAIMEYMACGLPVVATSAGGNVELVDASNGIIVPPGDPHALCEALYLLSRDDRLRREMGESSFKKISMFHTWDKVMQQWHELYLSLIESKGLLGQ